MTRRRRTAILNHNGPYHVQSYSTSADGMVLLAVFPAFSQYEEWEDGVSWREHRKQGDGGGPGIFASIGLAAALEDFLNAPYDEATIAKWKAIDKPPLRQLTKREKRAMEKRLEKA